MVGQEKDMLEKMMTIQENTKWEAGSQMDKWRKLRWECELSKNKEKSSVNIW